MPSTQDVSTPVIVKRKPRTSSEIPVAKPQNTDLLQAIKKVKQCTKTLADCNQKIGSQNDEIKNEPLTTASDGFTEGRSFIDTLGLLVDQGLRNPQIARQQVHAFIAELPSIIRGDSKFSPQRKDQRFRDAAWRENPLYRILLQVYLAGETHLEGWIDALDLSDHDRKRALFIAEQLSSAVAPSNWPLNPASVKRAIKTGGQSRLNGLQQLVEDWINNGGMPRQVQPDSFTLGVDLAKTTGAVVFKNEVLELIQYKPLTEAVYKRPVLLIPPQINKFYIFDLSSNNSMVKYLLQQGIQAFVISWRIPNKSQAHWDLDTYIKSIMDGINAIRQITGNEDINLVCACAGGLTSMALMGYLSAINKPWIHSYSLLVTALQSGYDTPIELFMTRKTLERARSLSRFQGVIEGKALSRLFAWMRPTDLVWNFWVNNYLLGKEPPVLDILYWDNDATCLSAKLHSDFIDMFLNDVFRQPGKLVVLGKEIDIKAISMDGFFLGGEADYLMPWQGCHDSQQLVGGNSTFVLSSGGHIQSVLRPPGIANTEYFINSAACGSSEQWMEGAERIEGSWWPYWSEWIINRSGASQKASATLGSHQYPALHPAPGQYVCERI